MHAITDYVRKNLEPHERVITELMRCVIVSPYCKNGSSPLFMDSLLPVDSAGMAITDYIPSARSELDTTNLDPINRPNERKS